MFLNPTDILPIIIENRPLLETLRNVKIVPMGPDPKGQFWYQGLETCLKLCKL